MIIINFFRNIKVSKYTYIIILLAFVTGQIKELIGLTIIILFHEFGHYFMSKLYNWKLDKIYLYPFGGLIKYNEVIDKPFKEELLITIVGPLNQIIIYLIFFILFKYHIINKYFFNIIKNYHYTILLFNLLPIIPLDGSKLLNILLNKIFCFRKSFYIINIISIIFIIIFIFKSNYSLTIIILFLIYKIYLNLKERDLLFNRFILEKYLYKNNFKKRKKINNIKNMKRNINYLIKEKYIYLDEKEYIKKTYY